MIAFVESVYYICKDEYRLFPFIKRTTSECCSAPYRFMGIYRKWFGRNHACPANSVYRFTGWGHGSNHDQPYCRDFRTQLQTDIKKCHDCTDRKSHGKSIHTFPRLYRRFFSGSAGLWIVQFIKGKFFQYSFY